jgi:hypothetical protein
VFLVSANHACAGRVRRPEPADQPRNRGDVDDRAAALRQHLVDLVLEAEEDAGQVDGQDAALSLVGYSWVA